MTTLSLEFQRHEQVPPFTRDLASVDSYRWSAAMEVPAIGTDVVIRMNGIGRARVVGYATVSGYLGVMTVPYAPPTWWVAQNGPPSDANAALAFGAELVPPETAAGTGLRPRDHSGEGS